MPKYTFICASCATEKSLYTTVSLETVKCTACGAFMKRQMPKLGSQEVLETIDSVTGVAWKQDQQALIKQRRDEHYWEIEVPRLVQKYSLETCLENKWLVYNEKGELVINKPPSKR
jgi:transcription elongation factor Elf1